MNRSRTDGPPSDVAVADNTLYRRPPARRSDPAGSPGPGEVSWFGGDRDDNVGGDQGDSPARRPAVGPGLASASDPMTTGSSRRINFADIPEFADAPERASDREESVAAASGGSSRVSYGFGDGPISPQRPSADPDDDDFAPASSPAPLSAVTSTSSSRLSPPSSSAFPPASSSGFSAADELSAFPAADEPVEVPRPAASPVPDAALSDLPPRGSDLPSGAKDDDDFFADRVATPANRWHTPGSRETAWRSDDPPVRPSDEPEEVPRRSRAVTVGMLALSAVVLVAGSILGVLYFAAPDGKLDSVLQLGAGERQGRAVTAPLDNRTRGSFEMLAGANRVNVSIGELGDELYRISTPEDAGILPSPQISGDDVKLQVTRDGDGTGGEIDVVLSAKVTWALRMSGYAEQQVIDLGAGRTSGVEMVAGAQKVALTLPKPDGTVTVTVSGAVDNLTVKSPIGNPVRVRAGGGAQSVVAGARTLKDVPAGSTVTPKNWATTHRYDVIAQSRITSLTLGAA